MRRLTVLRHGANQWHVSDDETTTTVDRLRDWLRQGTLLSHLFRYDEARLLTHRLETIGRPLKLGLLLRLVSRGACYVEDAAARRKQNWFASPALGFCRRAAIPWGRISTLACTSICHQSRKSSPTLQYQPHRQSMNLTVIEAFLSHVKGDIITDAALIAQYLESEWQSHFIKTPAPVDPAQ